MKKSLVLVLPMLIVVLSLFILACEKVEKPAEAPKQVVQSTQENIGEVKFNELCIRCHFGGNNIKDIKKLEDIKNTMRKPKPGMPTFDEEDVPNNVADAIAIYIFYSLISK